MTCENVRALDRSQTIYGQESHYKQKYLKNKPKKDHLQTNFGTILLEWVMLTGNLEEKNKSDSSKKK